MSQDKFPADYYSRGRDDLFSLVPSIPGLKVLDVGCGEGRFGSRLKENGLIVYGIEINPAAAHVAETVLDRVYAGNAEDMKLDVGDGFFDIIIFGDVLEHFIDPWSLLGKMKRYLADTGCVIASVPNLQYFPVLFNLIGGRFEYQAHGILDKSHLRFFTAREARKLFIGAGYEITGYPRFFPYKKKWAQRLAVVLDFVSFGTLRNYLVGHIHVVAGKAHSSKP